MGTTKLRCFLKCPRCGKTYKGETVGVWIEFPTHCDVCETKLYPEVEVERPPEPKETA